MNCDRAALASVAGLAMTYVGVSGTTIVAAAAGDAREACAQVTRSSSPSSSSWVMWPYNIADAGTSTAGGAGCRVGLLACLRKATVVGRLRRWWHRRWWLRRCRSRGCRGLKWVQWERVPLG